MAGLSVSVSAHEDARGRRSTVHLVGEADATTLALGQVLDSETAKRPRVLLVDASGLEFIDSFSVHLIARAYHKVYADGGFLAVIAPTPHVRRVLALSGLDAVLPVYATAEDADPAPPLST